MNVIIVGGGVSGLVCAHVFGKYLRRDEIKVLEPGKVGGEFLSGGLKYIHRTDGMADMFEDIGVTFSNYTVRGGMLIRGGVEPYPGCFQKMERDEAGRIQADHYRKTRRTEPGVHSRDAMNDPAATKPRRALRCHFPDMIDALAQYPDIVQARLTGVRPGHIETDKGVLPYDYLVMTIPLWIIKQVCGFEVPEGLAMKLNLVFAHPRRDTMARWDYVYTPYTPGNAIHRISPQGSSYCCEYNGDVDENRVNSDLHFIFKHGFFIERARTGLKGHLLPLESEPAWPDNIAPLGRFAKWDSRATTDVTLADAEKLAKRWFE